MSFEKEKEKNLLVIFLHFFFFFYIFCYHHEKKNIYKGGVHITRKRKSCEESLPEEEVEMHAIMIIGYGTKDGTNYWKIRNSWGESWGKQGYGRIARPSSLIGKEDMHLIFATSYPIPR